MILANEGLNEAKKAGLVPVPANQCGENNSKSNSGEINPVVVSASNDFCANPVGYLCGTAQDRVQRLQLFRQNTSFREYAIKQIKTKPTSIWPPMAKPSITLMFQKMQQAILQKIKDCQTCGSEKVKATMSTKIERSILHIAGIDEDRRFIDNDTKLCGSNFMAANADYNKDQNVVTLCLGEIINSLPPGSTMPDLSTTNIGAYLAATLGHELGHALDGLSQQKQKTDEKDFYNKMNLCMSERYTWQEGFREELNADYWGGVAMGTIDGAANFDAALKGAGGLCTTRGGSDGEHPPTVDRLKRLPAFADIARKMNCPSSSGDGCTNIGLQAK